MKLKHVRNLIFSYVESENLVREATGWRYEERDKKDVYTDAKLFLTESSRASYRLKFSHSLHRGVHLTLHMLNGLDIDTLVGKEKQLVQRHSLLDKNQLPLYLSRAETMKLGRNAKWKRYQAALALLGIVLDESAEREFTSLMYGSGTFSVRLRPDLRSFPLLEAFAELDSQLVNSGLFPNSHETYYYDKASSLEILNWAQRMQIEVPSLLEGTVKKLQLPDNETPLNDVDDVNINEDEKPTTKQTEGKSLNKRERESLLLIVNAMAKAKFFFKPEESFGPTVDKIDLAIQDTQASLSKKTIRKFLKLSEDALTEHLDRKR